MERNDVNIKRFARSIRDALDGLALEARCYGWQDDAEYFEIKRFLERCLDSVNGKEPEPLTLEELKQLPPGTHIWVKELREFSFPGQEKVYSYVNVLAALYDCLDSKGVTAVWNVESLDDAFREPDYGKKWWAYLAHPIPGG